MFDEERNQELYNVCRSWHLRWPWAAFSRWVLTAEATPLIGRKTFPTADLASRVMLSLTWILFQLSRSKLILIGYYKQFIKLLLVSILIYTIHVLKNNYNDFLFIIRFKKFGKTCIFHLKKTQNISPTLIVSSIYTILTW